jgi:hypothetical protein
VLDVFGGRIVARGQSAVKAAQRHSLPAHGGGFPRLEEALRDVFIENIRRFADGRPLRSVFDIRLGYVGSAPLVGTSRKGSIG